MSEEAPAAVMLSLRVPGGLRPSLLFFWPWQYAQRCANSGSWQRGRHGLHPLFFRVAKCWPKCNRTSGFSSLHHFEKIFLFLYFYSLKWVLRHGAFQTLPFLFSKYTLWAQMLMGVRSLRDKKLPHSSFNWLPVFIHSFIHPSIHSFIHLLST